jgi:hypothetical protein
MDKTIQNREENHIQKREGFALLITLSVLSVIIALTIVLLGYFDTVRKDAANTKALIQANIFYSNVLKGFLGHSPKYLRKKLYKRPSSLRKGRFNMSVDCKPLSTGININWLSPYLSKGEKRDKLYQIKRNLARSVYQMLMSEHRVKDPQELFKRILERIGGKKKYVQTEHSRLRQKNGIISYAQFEEIVTQYQLEVDDPKVGKVPWEKYFSFTREGVRIDAEYSAAELLHYLFQIELGTIREWQVGRRTDEDTRSLKQLVNDEFQQASYAKYAPILVAEKQAPFDALCRVGYNVGGHNYHFTFEYINGGGRHFEFFRQ